MPIVSFDQFAKGGTVKTGSTSPEALRAEIEGNAPIQGDPSDIPVDAKVSFFDRVKDSLTKRGAKLDETLSRDAFGDDALHPALKGLDILGQGAGFATDILGDAVETAVDALPEPVKEAGKAAGLAILNTEPGKAALSALEAGAEAWEGFKASNPDTARAVEGVVNVASIIPVGAGAKAAATKVADTAGDIVKTAKVAADDVAKAGPAAREAVRDAADAAGDIFNPIDKGTESVLNPTRLIPKENLKNVPIEKIVAQAEDKTAKLDNYLKISKDAVVDYSKPTALVKAGEKGGEALTVIQNKMSKQAQLKNEALGKVGDKVVKNVQEYRDFFTSQLEERVGVKVLTKADEIIDGVLKKGEDTLENAPGRKSKVSFDPADNKLIRDTNAILKDLGDAPTVREIDDTVDALQDLLYKRKTLTAVPVNGQVESIIKQMTGKLNRAVKKVGGEQYTKANAKYAYFVDTFEKLNKALGDEGVRGAQLMKSLFSPSGEAPRRLFAEIKKLTGIDLVEEATLAKFAMESIGDARQASLLEEVIRGGSITPVGFIEKAATHLIKKTQDPVRKAKRIINEKPTR